MLEMSNGGRFSNIPGLNLIILIITIEPELLNSENSRFLLSSRILINSQLNIENFGLNFPDNYMSRRQ